MTRTTMGLRMGHHRMVGLLAVGRMGVAGRVAAAGQAVAADRAVAVDQARLS
jgi:hypothetical protein